MRVAAGTSSSLRLPPPSGRPASGADHRSKVLHPVAVFELVCGVVYEFPPGL